MKETNMVLNLKNRKQLEKFNEYSKKLIKKGCRVELKKLSKARSLPQNNYFHLLCGFFGLEMGLSIIEVKHLIKTDKRICKDLFVYQKRGYEFVKSTAELNEKEFSVVIEKFKNFSANIAGVQLPDANEHLFLDSIKNRLEEYQNQVYL